MRRPILAVLVLVFSLAARQRAVPHPVLHPPPATDDSYSAAELSDIETEHLVLDLTVDFDGRRLHGSATHLVRNLTGTRRLVLDTRGLDISSVTIDGVATNWQVQRGTQFVPNEPLTIDIEPTTKAVRIEYATRPTAAGLQWFAPKQTLGDAAPFVYSHNQPDNTRSWLPVQDTPGMRMTWQATLRVPPGVLALMTTDNPTEPNDSGVYFFHQRRTLPAYLIAFAAGRLGFRALDERTGVYAEPELLDDAVWYSQDLPEMVDDAETILGRYPFPRYDLLFPPSFVAGGMENPMLNFISPGGLSADRGPRPAGSVLLAHELAHTWGGDLVTCSTWADTWLNEGFATYYSHRILGMLEGEEREELGRYLDSQGYYDQLDSIQPHAEVLHRTFAVTDNARSGFNSTSYVKGSMFFHTLEHHLGRETFDAFMKEYLRRRSFTWTDDRVFLGLLQTLVLDARPDLAAQLRLDEWIYGQGVPANDASPDRAAIWDEIGPEAEAFVNGANVSSLHLEGWTGLHETLFLWQIGQDTIRRRLADLDEAFGFSQRHGPPINWVLEVAKARYAPGFAAMERVLARGTNVIPIYVALAETPAGRTVALELYAKYREDYDTNTQLYLDLWLKPAQQKAA